MNETHQDFEAKKMVKSLLAAKEAYGWSDGDIRSLLGRVVGAFDQTRKHEIVIEDRERDRIKSIDFDRPGAPDEEVVPKVETIDEFNRRVHEQQLEIVKNIVRSKDVKKAYKDWIEHPTYAVDHTLHATLVAHPEVGRAYDKWMEQGSDTWEFVRGKRFDKVNVVDIRHTVAELMERSLPIPCMGSLIPWTPVERFPNRSPLSDARARNLSSASLPAAKGT